MKLLIDARVGWGHGIGRVIANTVPKIACLRPRWQLDILVPPANVAQAKAAFGDPDNIIILPCTIPPFSMIEQIGLERHVGNHDLTWFTNYWVPYSWRTPFVALVHDLLHILPEYSTASRVKRAMSRRTFHKVRRDARAVMFDSRFTENAFRGMIGAPRRGTTIALGGDHLGYGEIRPVTERTRRLLVVAASKKHKNFALLFDAWRNVAVADDWVLTIITPEEMLRTSVDLADMAGQQDRIDIRRGVSNDVLASLYADSAVLLMPSLYEGFGLPLLEGMLAGALCIASNAGAMVEIAEGAIVQFVNGNDLTGWINAIEYACSKVDRGHPSLAALQQHNMARARRFHWDRTAREIVAVLEQAAA